MPGPEKSTEQAFVKWVATFSLRARKMMVEQENFWPDRTIVLPGGRIICIEFKSPIGALSAGQEKRIVELRELDVPVLVTSNLEEAKEWTLCEMNRNSGRRTSTKELR